MPNPVPVAAASPADLRSLLASVTADAAFGSATGAGVRVGLLDSGVDPRAAGIRPVAEAAFRIEAGQVRRIDGPAGEGRSPHGSAVAQIIAGIAPGIELFSADVLDAHGRGGADTVLAGLDWLLQQGCRVINVSLGLTPADLPRLERRWRFVELLERAYFSDVVVVAAVHNHHDHGVSALPAHFASVIAVNKQTPGEDERFRFRENGTAEFAACAKSPHPDYRFHAATSFAAPQVTALVARMLERCPNLKPFEVKTVLYRAAAG